MRISCRTLIGLAVALLTGIFIGFLIVKSDLLTFHSEAGTWDAVSAIGTWFGAFGSILAAVIALVIAIVGWKKSDKARVEDIRRQEIESAKIAYSYFRRLGCIATLLASKNNVNFKNGNGQDTQRIEEIYDGWKHANNNTDCVRSIIYADNWATEIDLIDTFEMMIQVARSAIYLQGDRVLDNNRFEALSHALDVFARLSHLHAREIGGLKGTDLSVKIEKNAKQSLNKLKCIQNKIKEPKKSEF